MNQQEPIWSVSAVNRMVKDTIEGSFMPFWMGGEVGSLLLHRSGHAYFQMKDEKSQIKVCWFGGAAQCRELGIANGTIVEVRGNLSVYEVRGEYQFNVRQLRPAGIGLLQRKFEELKQRLAAEGLFDQSRKKPIPRLPRTIGVVSSPSGAAIRDFTQILFRRFPGVTLKLFPALVQGSNAAAQVAKGVQFFNSENDIVNGNVEVIVVTRGGGSMEDLWCFNDEHLARTIAASNIPVISAVGHEIDFTICDFVADLRAPTPSAAAELAVANYADILRHLEHCDRELSQLFDLQRNADHLTRSTLEAERVFQLRIAAERENCRRLDDLAAEFAPDRVVERKKQRLENSDARLAEVYNRKMDSVRTHICEAAEFAENALALQRENANKYLDHIAAKLHIFDPARQLERGYTIVYTADGRHIIDRSSKVKPGSEMQLRFADDTIRIKAL